MPHGVGMVGPGEGLGGCRREAVPIQLQLLAAVRPPPPQLRGLPACMEPPRVVLHT